MNFRTTVLAITTLTGLFVSAQKEPTKPEQTELWEPVPPVVSLKGENKIPSDAIVLFEGNDLSKWKSTNDGGEAKWKIDKKKGFFMVKSKAGDIETKRHFGSMQLHIEWTSPEKVQGEGQGRGNSGIFLQGLYEVQILDNYKNRTYSNGQASSVYKQYSPLVNACKEPGQWQTYDIIFHAPKFGSLGQMIESPIITVLHNGVLTQDHVKVLGTTEYIGWPKVKTHGDGALRLQDHGNKVRYRNIWVREL